MSKILVSENNKQWIAVISQAFPLPDEIDFLSTWKDCEDKLKTTHYDLVMIDFDPGDEDAFEHISNIKQQTPNIPIIIISRTDQAEYVVKLIKLGAFDFVTKPFSAARIQLAVKKAIETKSLKNEIDYLRRQQDIIYEFDDIVADSPKMKKLINILKKFTKTDSTILMSGETGTGKSFFSGVIHFNSKRKNKPFIKINCANIPENLLESELFGHEKGAFTGADKQRVGRFEQANGGTLFLDEIGEMSIALQAKLLRVLEENEFERLGDSKTIRSDVRVIAATNRHLEKQIEIGKFREDLYYRINILSVVIPPLRERSQDIELMAQWFLKGLARVQGKQIFGFSPSVLEWFTNYSWPGNIRQMANTIQRAVILEESQIIQKENIMMPPSIETEKNINVSKQSDRMNEYEKELIIKSLKECLWIQKDAANLLGITPRALNYKIKKYQITHPRWRKNRKA